MDTKLIDVFVSYSRADSVRVEAWVKRLRKGGIVTWFDLLKGVGRRGSRITAQEAAQRCEVLIWFVSKFSKESMTAGKAAAAASENGKTVIIVALDASGAPPMFDLALPRTALVNLVVVGQQAAWEATLKAVRAQGVPWVPPTSRRKRSRRPNELRSAAMARGWLRAAIFAGLILVAGSLALTRFNRSSHEAPPMPTPVAVVEKNTGPKPLLSVATDEAPTKIEPPVKPSVTQQDLADPLTLKAIEHVRRCIEAANRENGLTEAQMDAITNYWADPAFMEDRGLQDAKALKASMTLNQQKAPKWKET
ncbi:MAG: hypothetical protein JWO08_4040, partial [Verrucomicrobiaceae bacterium]|nr:hypothetical protein [Verrucomicrobiaceae bacterium]